MKRSKHLTKRERRRLAYDEELAQSLEHALEADKTVRFDIETSTITGRMSSKEGVQLSLPRMSGKGIAIRELIQHFNENYPDLEGYFTQHVDKPQVLVIHDESAGFREYIFGADYASVEKHVVEQMKEDGPRGSYDSLLKAMGLDEEELRTMGEEAVERGRAFSQRAT